MSHENDGWKPFQRSELPGLALFWWRCIKLAFTGSYRWIERVSTFVAIIGLAANYLLNPSGQEKQMIDISIPAWLLVGIGGTVAILGILMAPFRLFTEEKDRADALTKRQEPKLRVRVDIPSLKSVPGGSTSETGGGRRYSAYTSEQHFIKVYFTNDGLEVVRGCSCKLLQGWEKSDGGWKSLGLIEAIELSWSDDQSAPRMFVDIEPNETKAVNLASIHAYGYIRVARDMKSLPLEYQQLFGEPGEYQALIQIRSKMPDPLQIIVQFSTYVPPPEPNVLPRPLSNVKIVLQGQPPLTEATP